MRVLVKTTLKTENCKTILAALDKGIKDAPNRAAACFKPRHGVRATHDGKTVDLVICFVCFVILIDVDGKFERNPKVTGSPQEAFGEVLTAAKVPLPKAEGK
jgi:hypothetical protein